MPLEIILITVHFIDEDQKLSSFVMAAVSFLGRHAAENMEAYGNVFETFKLTTKGTKVVSDNAASMIKAFQVSLKYRLHKTNKKSDINEH